MVRLDMKIEELLFVPFTFVENIGYDWVKSTCFFEEVRVSLPKRDFGMAHSILIWLLVEALETVCEHYFDDEDETIDKYNHVSNFLKILTKHKSFSDKSVIIPVPIGKYKFFEFTEYKLGSLTDISLTEVVQIFRDYLALKEKKIKEPTIEQFCENEKRMKELEAQLATLKEENEKLKIKNNQISKIISEM